MKSFSQNLLRWYRKNKRSLPWRETKDPYKIWISEVMLQQTTVNAVIPYYEKWIIKYPTIQALAKASLEKVLKQWQGLGYYQRVRNLHKAANIILDNHKGKFPKDPEILKTLPGFGPYTVGAVSSIAFNIKYPIVDANVRRVIMRFLAIEGLADTSKDKQIIPFLEQSLPTRNVGDFNQALMELGALVCKSKGPMCLLCPLQKTCRAFQKGIQEIIPETKKKIIKELNVAVGVIQRDKKYFIQKRPEKGLLAGLWEFPGGKLEKGERPKDALQREIKEEIDVEIFQAKSFTKVVHFYTEFKVNLHVFLCRLQTLPKARKDRKWVSIQEFTKYPMPSGTARIVEKLRESHPII